MSPFTREKIENWAGDFCGGDALREFSTAAGEFAPQILTAFLVAACECRGVEPDEVAESDLKTALLEHVARLQFPVSIRPEVPTLCGAFLAQLEADGRLGGGRTLGAYVRALGTAFVQQSSGKAAPITRPGSRIGRNDPCPCGSGRKYKKCCMGE